MPQIIQFMHPGSEPTPPSGSSIIPWNYGDKHKRKFMVSKGKYVSDTIEKEDCLTFWGEWEPQSKVERLPCGRFSKYLNWPFLDVTVPNRLHNTDPNVFGSSFKYFCCQQGAKSSLRNLSPLSLILFGSCVGKQFCLDTLLVVSKRNKPYHMSNVRGLANKKDQFYHASIEPLNSVSYCNQLKCNMPKEQFRYYEGVTFSEQKDYQDIFSFAPVRRYDEKNQCASMFKRPVINISGIISNGLTQGINGQGGRIYSDNEVVIIWKEIVKQVRNQELELGTQFENPPRYSVKAVQEMTVTFSC